MSYDPYPSHPYRPPDPPPPHDPYAYTYTYGTHETYPWAPREAPEPAGRRPQHNAALGHHSDLRVLRSAYRWQRRVATLTALGYFILFLILSAFAPSFMTSTVTDGLPTGLLLALLQVPVTWLAIGLYEQTARRRVDPIADRIRKLAELDARREGAR
ncbi:hypothetical protein ADK65_36160 [Streptomyces sp. NRRL B-1140]|uniref:DUF485 domain-containing protein n=1 Tax=Streptomyces sp. NRRL B-1140 TaxID=1415549 RepID=UPI0006AFBB70|nr:DUF485 domain-containing protein [Streptomyces sp. NRRL B-1140]KOV90917.1 hypothetical protein ADK65_36160 [Streptomyces sp. NRRL B-1140]